MKKDEEEGVERDGCWWLDCVDTSDLLTLLLGWLAGCGTAIVRCLMLEEILKLSVCKCRMSYIEIVYGRHCIALNELLYTQLFSSHIASCT